MKRTLCVIVASMALLGAVSGAEPAEPANQKPSGESISKNVRTRATQEEANSYFGMTEQALTETFGQAFEIKKVTSPNGVEIKYLHYVDDPGFETIFTMYSHQGIVISGLFRGTIIRHPGVSPAAAGPSQPSNGKKRGKSK